ncbi:hypothetical protein KJ830_03965 [bacterium]|nr:hypothetical protein [bacterium]MBU4510188.1 hypothetical protein [bacterium]
MAELKPGCILYDTKFVFKDNEIGEKLIVLLNNPRGNEPFLFCRTTSIEKPPYQIKIPSGCQKNSQYFFINTCIFFPKDTWLLLRDIYEYDKARILKKAFDKEISIINSINDIILRQIKNCVKDSIDISEKYLKMILETIV